MSACFRKDDAHDPAVYAAAAIAVFSEYDLGVVDYITDPRTGLPSRLNWLPTIKEIRDACDAKAQVDRASDMRDMRTRQQLAERDAFEAEQRNRPQRPSYSELRGKHDGQNGEPWGIQQERVDAERKEKLRAQLAESNERVRLSEYHRAGVEPLAGKENVSLSLLLSFGWTIKQMRGRRMLIPPPPKIPEPIQEREQS